MKIEVHVHMHADNEVKRMVREMYEKGVKIMAESPEMVSFRESVGASLDNIAQDIQQLLDRPTGGLSDEDKAALSTIAQRAGDLANVVKAPGEA